MSILSGFIKTRKYRKTSSGYKWQSEDTSSQTVFMDDGNTAETNLGAIKGITDSTTATNSNVALSAAGGNNLQVQIDTINSNLGEYIFHSLLTIEGISINAQSNLSFNFPIPELANYKPLLCIYSRSGSHPSEIIPMTGAMYTINNESSCRIYNRSNTALTDVNIRFYIIYRRII